MNRFAKKRFILTAKYNYQTPLPFGELFFLENVLAEPSQYRAHLIYSRSVSLPSEKGDFLGQLEEEVNDDKTLDTMERGMLLDAVDVLMQRANGN